MRSLVTILAFAGKEIRQVLRQPKLMSALIVGPFIILGLFAAGFQPDQAALRTLLVMAEDSPLAAEVERLGDDFGGEIEMVGVTDDEDEARSQLLEGEIDLIVIAPPDPAASIRADEHATVVVLHNRLDPFDRAAIYVSAQTAVEHLNRSILAEVAAAAQDRVTGLDDRLPAAREAVSVMAEASRDGDRDEEAAARAAADEALGLLEQQMEGGSGFIGGLDLAGADEDGSLADQLAEVRSAFDEVGTGAEVGSDLDRLESGLATLESAVAAFQAVSPEVWVRPFVAETESASGVSVPITAYYSPAVIVVLLQHVVLTFAALSIVSERALGTTELFRVGPARTTELLIGKLIGYAVLGALVGALLTVVVVFVLGTPMAGSWVWMSVVLALTMTASLGLGFVIASVAGTEAQAVQYAMLALLFTIFFSGLVVSLERLAVGVQQAAFLAPATAATSALHDVMFRGQAPRLWLMGVLALYTLATLALARWWLGRQRIA